MGDIRRGRCRAQRRAAVPRLGVREGHAGHVRGPTGACVGGGWGRGACVGVGVGVVWVWVRVCSNPPPCAHSNPTRWSVLTHLLAHTASLSLAQDDPGSIGRLDPDTTLSHHSGTAALKAAGAVCAAVDRLMARQVRVCSVHHARRTPCRTRTHPLARTHMPPCHARAFLVSPPLSCNIRLV